MIKIAGEADREFSDDELEMLQEKMHCTECSDSGKEKGMSYVSAVIVVCVKMKV